MKKYLAVFCLSLLSACSLNRTPAPPQITYFTHRIKYQGETLGQIARWYTGTSNNWKEIQRHNQGLDPRKIRVGDTILIPENLVVRKEAPPRPKVELASVQPKVELIEAPESLVSETSALTISDEQVEQEPEAVESEQVSEPMLETDVEEPEPPSAAFMPQALPVKHIPSREALWDQLLNEE